MNDIVIKFPYAQAHELNTFGGTVGDRAAEPDLVQVTLPAGWSAGCARHGVPGVLTDQHGRRRVTVSWTMHSGPDGIYYDTLDGAEFCAPDTHAREVAEDGASLVLDRWATPSRMIGCAAERVETFHYLIESSIREGEEQPERAARLGAQRQEYQRKLASWEHLFARLAQEIRRGWTVRTAVVRDAG